MRLRVPWLALVLPLFTASVATAAPGDVLFTDDFERASLGSAWTTTNTTRSDINTDTANSGTRSLFVRYDPVTTTVANDIDLAVPRAVLELWVRHGSDAFSEYPDNNEDLVVEYFNSSSTWVELVRYEGGGTAGQIFAQTLALPDDALHSAFRFRLRLTNGSGVSFDYFHIDDVEVRETEDLSSGNAVCDDFEDGVPYATVITGGGFASVNTLTSQSAPNSMSLNGDVIGVASPVRDTSSNFLGVTIWIRRGDDAFSEDPDGSENLVLSYLNNVGTWVDLETFTGSGTPGEIFDRSYDLSGVGAAQHAGFRLRLRQTDGDGTGWDFWHFDDVCFVSSSATVAASVAMAHDGAGTYCVEETVTVTVRDAVGDPLVGYVGTVQLSTDTSRGSWRLVSGSGALVDATANDGAAEYTFDVADNGTATLGFTYTDGAGAVDIDALETGGGATDDDSEGSLVFGAGGYTVTASALANPPPATINDPVGNQIAGTDYTVHLAAYGDSAVDAACGVIEDYSGPRNLEFWQQWTNPGSGSVVLTVGGIGVGVGAGSAVAQNVTFVNGQAELTLKYKDVGSISLYLREVASGISGNTNVHVVRPADLVVTTVETLSGTPNPGAGSATGAAFVASGAPFRVQVEARDAENDRTPNYGLETPAEGIRLSSAGLQIPAAGRNGQNDDGVLVNDTAFSATATPGRFQNDTVLFDEVGVVRLQAAVADGSYLGAGSVPGTVTGNVGRFVVDEFVMTSGALTPSCNTFTYMDEDALTLAVEVEARNVLDQRTRNYDSTWLGAGGVVLPDLTAENADDGVDLSARLTVTPDTWNEGLYALNVADAVFARAVAVDGPYDTLDVGVAMNDTIDSRALANLDINPATSGDCTLAADCSARLIDTTAVAYGRVQALPAQGSEEAALDLGLVAQRWDGAGFVTNVLDVCSTYALADITLGAYTGNLADGDTVPVGPVVATAYVAGVEDSLAPPLLSAPGLGNDGTVLVSWTVDGWLEFDWLGLGATGPSAPASFGYVRGHDRIVYWQEVTR